MTLRHVVMMKLADCDPQTKADRLGDLAAGLRGLKDAIPNVEALSVGTNIRQAPTDWDLVLIVDLADSEALAAYAAHPAHLEQVSYIRGINEKSAVVDYCV